jgi:hypothetical protein
MSYVIEYQYAMFCLSTTETGLEEDRYVVAIEAGSNNSYDGCGGNARRSRQWSICMLGTETQVIQRAVYAAGGCEGGMLKPMGRDCSPEAYISRIRRLLAGEPENEGFWIPEIRAGSDHPIVADMRAAGIDLHEEKVWDHRETRAAFPRRRLGEFFRLVDRYHTDLPGWAFGRVYGLPPS